MLKMNRINILITILSFWSIVVFGQTLETQVLNTTGGFSQNQNSSISLEFNVGEIAINKHQNSWITITEGVIQPKNDINTSTENTLQEFDISIYPNPMTSYLVIEPKEVEIQNIRLYNLLGQELLSQSFQPNLNIGHLTAGNYLLELIDKNKRVVGRYSLVKINSD